jgi:hypothetical protein
MKIEHIDNRGKGYNTFRFFSYNEKGDLIWVKAKGKGTDYHAGDEIDDDCIIDHDFPNAAQLKRWDTWVEMNEFNKKALEAFAGGPCTIPEKKTEDNKTEEDGRNAGVSEEMSGENGTVEDNQNAGIPEEGTEDNKTCGNGQNGRSPKKRRKKSKQKRMARIPGVPKKGRKKTKQTGMAGMSGAPKVRRGMITRIIRDTKIIGQLKTLYKDKCQICGCTIQLIGRTYSEGHHVKPLGNPHHGPDHEQNIIIVCPNCHVKLDNKAISIDKNELSCRDSHSIADEYINYHNNIYNENIYRGPK